jgi:uncharacterized membrane protein YfcA
VDNKLLILFGFINILASALSGATGGGGGLITTPLLVAMGVPPSTAIATAKFSGLGISSGASLRFFKEKITDPRTVIIFSILSGMGAIAGSLLLVHLTHYEHFLEKAMAVVILILGIPLLYMKNLGLKTKTTTEAAKIVGSFLLALGVLLQVVLSSGIGSLQLIVLMSFFGMTALTASATRRAMQLTVAVISLGVFIVSGIVDYKIGIVSLVTAALGGYIGAHVAIKKGNKFVVNLFAIISALLALQLLLR